MSNKSITAIAVFNSPKCKGTVTIKDSILGGLVFDINLTNLKPGLHGFHVHEAGNLSDGCGTCCAHFNPLNKKHGGPFDGKNRHLGDLGNITVDKNGKSSEIIYGSHLKLRGSKYNIIGRSIVVHEDEDDLGVGGDAESLKTGNAGARIGCAVIGYKDTYYF